MKNIADRVICLKLNAAWMPVETQKVQKAVCDLITGVCDALDIQYPLNEDGTPDLSTHNVRPVAWDEWITLPVNPWQPSIKATRDRLIRVPTVLVAKNYARMPDKEFKGKPTKEGLFFRDKGRDAYTGKLLDWEEATIDHVVPSDRGGADSYDNTVLTTREINNWKGRSLNNELRQGRDAPSGLTFEKGSGLKLLITPRHPKKVPKSWTIRTAQHVDWTNYLVVPQVSQAI